jgi:BCD family chlorophyll transporter-like MFS transporter
MNQLARADGIIRLLVVICLGTFGFGMADALLEPYGGQVLGLSIADTTKLTALFSVGTLVGFAIASRLLSGTTEPGNLALAGLAVGIPGFGLIIFVSMDGGTISFLLGTFLVGLGTGLFGHATLTAAMRAAPREQIGLALGAWGAAQACAAGLGVALAGIVRDVIVGLQGATGNSVQTPCYIIFTIEALSLLIAIAVVWPMARKVTNRKDIHTTTEKQVEGL